MQIRSINSNSDKSNSKPTFCRLTKPDMTGMLNNEIDVLCECMPELKALSKGVKVKIALGISDSGRYFDTVAFSLKKADSESEEVFRANPRTIINANSPKENIKIALFNSLNRAKAAYLKNEQKIQKGI